MIKFNKDFTNIQMKLFVTAFLFCSSVGWCAAQTDTLSAPTVGASTLSAADSVRTLTATPVFKKNNIKVNLSSLLLNNYSFSYERSLSQRVSMAAGYRFMPKTTLDNMALARHISEKYVQDEEIHSELDNIATSNSTITGEVRLYGGRHPGARGFYVAAYGRYMRSKVDYLDEYQSVENRTYQIPYHTTLNGFGGGLMFGAQWLIADRVTLDWYILGAHYGKLTGDIEAVTNLSGMTDAEKAGLEEDIEHYVSFSDRISVDATVTDNGAKAKADGPFVGIRGLGINIGIAF